MPACSCLRSPGAAPAVGALASALREMVRRMAPDYCASAQENAQPDGTLMLKVDGEFAHIHRLILAVFYEGFCGLHVEVARPEMLAAPVHLYPLGLSARIRDLRGLSYWL